METADVRAQLLKTVLRNRSLEYGDRSDAIDALLKLKPDFLEDELIAIAGDATEDADLIEDAGEALGILWVERGTIAVDKFHMIQPQARKLVLRLLDNSAASTHDGPRTHS